MNNIIDFEIPVTKRVEETPIEALALSNRAENSLHRFGIDTIGAILDMGVTGIADLRSVGKTTVSEIMTKVFEYTMKQLPEEKQLAVWLSIGAEINYMKGVN